MKRLFRIALWVLAALFVIVITLALNEVLIFASRTEASAQGQAKQDFLRPGVNHPNTDDHYVKLYRLRLSWYPIACQVGPLTSQDDALG